MDHTVIKMEDGTRLVACPKEKRLFNFNQAIGAAFIQNDKFLGRCPFCGADTREEKEIKH